MCSIKTEARSGIRHIPSEILSLDQLGVPAVTKGVIKAEIGIVLVTGRLDRVKYHTCWMVDYINSTRRACHYH